LSTALHYYYKAFVATLLSGLCNSYHHNGRSLYLLNIPWKRAICDWIRKDNNSSYGRHLLNEFLNAQVSDTRGADSSNVDRYIIIHEIGTFKISSRSYWPNAGTGEFVTFMKTFQCLLTAVSFYKEQEFSRLLLCYPQW